MSKVLTHKEAMQALIDGKTLISIFDKNDTITMHINGYGFQNQHGDMVNPDFINDSYTLRNDPPETVTVTKDQLIRAYEEHVIGVGAGRVKDVGGFVPFLKQLGFK